MHILQLAPQLDRQDGLCRVRWLLVVAYTPAVVGFAAEKQADAAGNGNVRTEDESDGSLV